MFGAAALVLSGIVLPDLVLVLKNGQSTSSGGELETVQRARSDLGRSPQRHVRGGGGDRRILGQMDKEDFPKYF